MSRSPLPGGNRPLDELKPTLPREFYVDADHHRRELEVFWYSRWICVGRTEGLTDSGQYQCVSIGDQEILVVRNTGGTLKGFHNTCRHRGSILCEAKKGRFNDGRIVCPYHAWTYTLDGALTHTPWRIPSTDFDFRDHMLHQVSVGEWAGFLFLHLDPNPSETLTEYLGELPALFSNWKLETSVSGDRMHKVIDCNWKIFWENFSECYHCPGIHPELSRIVPRFQKGILRASDEPGWTAQSGPDPDTDTRLAPGMVTWSDDGLTQLPDFPDLSAAERSLGQTFGTLLPSCFIAGHIDFVRFGHVLPLGPEQTLVTVECLFPSETLEDTSNDISKTTEFIRRLTEQDFRVCELNQRGLHCRRHDTGVLVPQEYYTHNFQNFVREGLGCE